MRKAAKTSSLFDASMVKDFLNSPVGRQLLADILIAAAGAAAAALLASNKGSKAMGKAAMMSAQTAALGVLANAMSGTKEPARRVAAR